MNELMKNPSILMVPVNLHQMYKLTRGAVLGDAARELEPLAGEEAEGGGLDSLARRKRWCRSRRALALAVAGHGERSRLQLLFTI